MTAQVRSLGLVGARGYVGRELLSLIAIHPHLQIAYAVSRSGARRELADIAPEFPIGLTFEDLTPEAAAARGADAVVLMTPNGEAASWARAIEATSPETVIVDVSTDHRFDDGWIYGLPERNRDRLHGARRIANPGCYATALALAAGPLLPVLHGPVHAFGVSGYSGAGRTPNPRNDPERVRDNLMPYALADHMHERESRRHLSADIRFAPHVAPFFRGLTVTVMADLRMEMGHDDLRGLYRTAYSDEPMVVFTETAPEARDVADRPHAAVGGVTVADDGRRAIVVGAVDNLLKGAASQVIQNLNLAFGFDETTGLRVSEPRK